MTQRPVTSALRAAFCILYLALTACARVIDLPDQAAAAAQNQLALIDAADYDRSWQTASPIFQAAVQASDWAQRAQSIRGPLGTLVGRQVRTAVGKTDPAASPKGEYIMITHDSAFERNDEVVETLVLYQDPDGVWRMAGYFVK